MRLIDADELKETVFSKSDTMEDTWDTAGVLNLINNAQTVKTYCYFCGQTEHGQCKGGIKNETD